MTFRQILTHLYLLFALLVLTLTTSAHAEAATTVAVVDLASVLTKSNPGIALQEKIEKFNLKVSQEMRKKIQIAEEMKIKMTDKKPLPDDEFAKKQKALQDHTFSMHKYQDEKAKEVQQLQINGLNELEKKLEPILEKIRDRNGYDVILNNNPGIVIMVSKRVDITKKVIDALNAAR